ncbi:MAG: UDP-3-O-(3-hydroxymyristoyl)glucosamine N-acyltransferase [Gammaproteobacteria bacterium]|nr:UDP-3-O-(3-hydroxymyristoyl)glucosamine N-acyltransferase [Gammaproteobacteria bacterium]
MSQSNRYTLGELAGLLDVTLEGDADCLVTGLATLSEAGEGQISFLSNPAYTQQLKSCKASAVILTEKAGAAFAGNRLISTNPYVTFARATQLFDPTADHAAGIHPTAFIAASARVAAGVSIGPHAVVEDDAVIGAGCRLAAGVVIGRGSQLGEGVRLYPNVVLYHSVSLGDRVVVHSGSVIGADGFGFAFDGEKSIKIVQLGGVRIGNDVEIGAATTIDRGALQDTVIGNGVKIDNQVQIGHNCVIGNHTIICGCAALAGSVTVGEYCIFGGGSGAVGHITVADRVQVSAMALLHKSVTEAGMVSSGTLAAPTAEWKRNALRFQQLDSLTKRLKDLERKVD